ncbi:hypothetical protein [Aegicerativicinus sediminis]|uniref:hypothetical protein n=1 Tax=Aegicerativicinus sediminis TaxID=2893202 RepID=UPI001E2EC20C|nr:hypothetical protein [Aegicerativicinus sediminis]
MSFQQRNLSEYGELIPITNTALIDRTGRLKEKYYRPYKIAFYRDLKFKIYESFEDEKNYNFATIEGSLHKYSNEGLHNFNDFSIQDLNNVVRDIQHRLNLSPKNLILKQLEIGLNLRLTEFKSREVIKGCLMYRRKRFKNVFTKDEGEYIQVFQQRRVLKIYDKALHYLNKGFDIKHEILRIELKYQRMNDLKEKGIYSLQDLLDFDFTYFMEQLSTAWKNVLYVDEIALHNHNNKFQYLYPFYWEQLTPSNFQYHREKLIKILSNSEMDKRQIVSNLIKGKAKSLIEKTIETNY